MTVLEQRLQKLIATQGPITISQFISLCLADKEQGYYHQADPFGAQGDFITAPEVSQMFGEMLGLWVVNIWQKWDQPQEFVFCEMGPGRGTLMDDMVRTIKKLSPDFFDHARVILIETSQKLRSVIAEKLKPHELAIEFADTVEKLPLCPLILVSNELLDCLPIHQYVRGQGGWHERMVALDAAGHLCFSLSPHLIDSALLPPHANDAPLGTLIEISPAREGLIAWLAQHISTTKGAALFIDYGALTGGFGDTLQALSKHAYQDPLARPGAHDLTSHVDFAALCAQAQASGCTTATATQGEFLERLGIQQRAAQLCAGRDPSMQQKIALALERLTADQEMGSLFKVFCLSHPTSHFSEFVL